MKKIFILAVLFTLPVMVFASEPGAKVITAFQRQFPKITNVHWYSQRKAFIAYFSEGEITYSLTYNSKGKLLSSIRYYNQDYLPFFVKAEVQRQYRDLSIESVTEVTTGGQTVYEIHLKDAFTLVNLQADQFGELIEVARYERAGVTRFVQ